MIDDGYPVEHPQTAIWISVSSSVSVRTVSVRTLMRTWISRLLLVGGLQSIRQMSYSSQFCTEQWCTIAQGVQADVDRSYAL